jgi:copper(I)-binding protein
VVTGVLVATAVAGCSAGFDATSVQPYAPSDGVLAERGDIKIQNALVVSSSAGTVGVVSAAVANTGKQKDTLTGITSPDGTVDFTGKGNLPPNGALVLGADTNPSATLSGMTRLPGETIRLTFTFRRGEAITLETVVVPATGDYASVTPPATAEPSGS